MVDANSNRFLEGFSPEGRQAIADCLVTEEYPDGAYLFRENDVADGICLVIDGEVEIIKSAKSREQILRSFLPGDYLGEVAVLDGQGRSTSARARGAVTIGKIPSEPLLRILSSEPISLTIGLFQRVLAHLREANEFFVREVVRKEKMSLVGEMAGSLMHDIRNPIAGIRLSADLVSMNHSDGETVQCCDGIRLQCDRLVAMASELLEFSRGETKLHVARTDTATFLQQFEQLNHEYFKKTGITFNFMVDPAEIEIDSMRLMRVLQNLITNAVEALGDKPGGCIEVSAWVQDGIFCLSVSDNGPGIPDEIRDRIFEPFVTHGKKNGTGLGMAIVNNVVTAQGGTISIDTEKGKGTTFLVQLPQASVAAAPVTEA